MSAVSELIRVEGERRGLKFVETSISAVIFTKGAFRDGKMPCVAVGITPLEANEAIDLDKMVERRVKNAVECIDNLIANGVPHA